MTHRPSSFDSFCGQQSVVQNVRIAVRSALCQTRQLGHILFTGPAGLGKTTLAASVLPFELGVTAKMVNCAAIEKAPDIARVLTSVPDGAILFLDELHALPGTAREHLLTAMEDGVLSVRIGGDTDSAQILSVRLPPMTIVGATTRQGLLDGPLRSRFQHVFTLTPYDTESMVRIIAWHAERRGAALIGNAAATLVPAAQGVARRAVNLLEACIDTHFDQLPCVEAATPGREAAVAPQITVQVVERTLSRLGFRGEFDSAQWRYLGALVAHSSLGLRTLSDMLDECEQTVEDVIEPYLIQAGYVDKSPRGRRLTTTGIAKMALKGCD